MKDQYKLIITPDGEAFFSSMYAPLARQIGVDRRTIKRWFDDPSIAKKKGYGVYVAYRAIDYKKGSF